MVRYHHTMSPSTPSSADAGQADDPSEDPDAGGPGRSERFLTTRWSMVQRAGRDTASARDALESLCRSYWYPLYGFVRRRGFDAEDAGDLTQEFFARLLEKGGLASVDRERGRFRSWLRASMQHFLSNELDRARTLKRGGGVQTLPLELEGAEERFLLEPSDPHTPEKAFDKAWALVLLDRVLARLGRDYRESGRGPLFEALEPRLVETPGAPPMAEVAAQLGMSEGAVKVALHRLRGRYREALAREIAGTVSDPAAIGDELAALFEALAD